ncbi:trypsin-like peptidase domain-containing protein [Rhizobium binae]|uniref:S1 family peptidase n=1 Tax=Rhizobium binae TaxID=1138190 RepID=UPI001C83CF28|nr:trypsin-like peptidase domain-containing protein [Rhizobium binae]
MPKILKRNFDSIAILLNAYNVPVGTAFLVEFRGTVFEKFVYLVTCAHCVQNAVTVRLNDKSTFKVPPEEWVHAPGNVDLVAVDVTGHLSKELFDQEFIPEGAIPYYDPDKPGDLRQYWVGDEIYILGLHVNEGNTGNNDPRARFGYLSGWNVKATQGNGHEGNVLIGDVRSRSGFSGSPVFAFRPHESDPTASKQHLIGIHSGQFPERIEVTGTAEKFMANISSGMTIMVPSWKLRSFLQEPTFVAQREARQIFPNGYQRQSSLEANFQDLDVPLGFFDSLRTIWRRLVPLRFS